MYCYCNREMRRICKPTRRINSNNYNILLLNFICIGPTSLQLVILALKDVLIRPGMTHGVNPLNEY
jgi:hypothetical protein